MDKNNKENLKNILIEKKKHKEKLIESITKNNIEVSSELSNYDNHPAELGSELFEIEHNNGLKSGQKKEIRDIDEALKKVDTDNYGICKECGKPIDLARLEILPQSKLCITCANVSNKEHEIAKKNSKLNRPVEEQTFDAPFGRKYLNSEKNNKFEQIEQLNDVLKYGSSDSPQDISDYKDSPDEVEEIDKISNNQYKSQL